MYTRVFESILDSSINVQSVPPAVRWLWITIMLIADRNRTGIVDMPVERLAARAGLSIEETRRGLEILSSPDSESTSPEEEGRRLVPIREDVNRGWRLVNWDKYRQIATSEHQREMTRKRVRAYRERSDGNAPVTRRNVTKRRRNTSEVEAAASSTSASMATSPKADGARRAAGLLVPDLPLADKFAANCSRDRGPWWLAALICEEQANLRAHPSMAYLRAVVKRRAADGWSPEDAMGYVEHVLARGI